MTTLNGFASTLRDQIAATQAALVAAQQGNLPRQVYRHSARLLDLLDRAARDGVDTSGWVREDVLAVAYATCPDA
ncbi:MAG TPA: hypothetical protein VIU11_22475 [Nakamurella sp.]